MNSAVLLDTHAAIWIAGAYPLSSAGKSAVDMASEQSAAFVSPITAWEVATLVSKKRLSLTMDVGAWFESLLRLQGAALAQMPPRVLIASRFLPGDPPSDPADRILAATAREYGMTLLTRDRLLLDYAERGHLNAIAC
ncbi:MAG: type II toxin-antitoxin system VapC family toxin [Hyphomicrobiales bacterium]